MEKVAISGDEIHLHPTEQPNTTIKLCIPFAGEDQLSESETEMLRRQGFKIQIIERKQGYLTAEEYSEAKATGQPVAEIHGSLAGQTKHWE